MAELAHYKRELDNLHDVLADLLRPAGLDPKAFARSAMILTERTPQLADCSMESWVASMTSLAVVRLMPDGVTGQSFVLPFKGVATPVIGYKGYNTLAGRAGWSLTGSVVREGDEFDYELGSRPYVRHRRALSRSAMDAPVIAAWACASAPSRSPLVSVLSIAELEAVKARSPSGRKPNSPWNDPAIGFGAMCAKTAKRRLGRDLGQEISPDYHRAVAMEEAHEERGLIAYLRPDGDMVTLPPPGDGDASQVGAQWKIVMGSSGRTEVFNEERTWRARWSAIVDQLRSRPEVLRVYRDANVANLQALGSVGIEVDQAIWDALRGAEEAVRDE